MSKDNPDDLIVKFAATDESLNVDVDNAGEGTVGIPEGQEVVILDDGDDSEAQASS